MYDLIGDIHGHASELAELLRRLGYRRRAGVFRHRERTAIFVGDFLDRGPEIRETLRLVRGMLEAGSALAVLGNHEWNAFAFHTPDPDLPGEYLRRHFDRNLHQVAATVAQVPAAELASHLAFLRTLPVRLEIGQAGRAGALRVVHACWDEVAFGVIDEAWARHGGLSDAFLVEGSNSESLLFAALEIVLKGKEMQLPPGDSLVDKDGQRRTLARVRWYAPTAGQTVASYALPHFPHLSPAPLPAKVVAEARPYRATAPPVFFGHYWLNDPAPVALAPNVFCLDYSVAAGGFLAAYRFGGEQDGEFVTVPSRPRIVPRSS
ncbi:MAG: metallophosphoesterase [Thermoanaerobaculia bacterium]|nr:metallophosphoesterase [Thermoanaerobaculia bacterium]